MAVASKILDTLPTHQIGIAAMISGYEECPDRDPQPTFWGVALDLSLILAIAHIAVAWSLG